MPSYYWNRYETISTTTNKTTYSNNRITASGSGSGGFSVYPFGLFDATNGYYSSGSSFTPTVGDTGYFVQSATVMIEYYFKSITGTTLNYDYWRYECTATSTPTTTYSKGSFITTFVDDGNAYTSGARNSDGYWYERGSEYTVLYPPDTPSNFRKVNQPDQTSILLAWNASSGASTYSLEAYNVGTTTNPVSQNYGLGGTSKTISGLVNGRSYDFKLYAVNSDGNSSPTWLYNIKINDLSPTAPQNLKVTVSTGPKATLTWDAVSGASTYSAEIYIQGTSTVVKSAYTFTGNSIEFSGLELNKNYTAKVYGNNTYGTGTPSYENFSTSTTRPNNWSWSSLTSSIHFSATYLDNGIRKGNIVNASEWNNFCIRINDFRKYKGLSAYSFTSVSSKQALTPAIYNEAVTAIGAMKSVSQTGGFYTKLVALKDALNSIT